MPARKTEKDETRVKPIRLRDKTKALCRQAVLDAAEQVFGTKGINGARISDIARLAGVSVGTVYNHFSQKEDILLALVANQEKELKKAVTAQDGDPTDFLGALCIKHERVFELITKHINFYSFALYEGIFDSDLVPAESVFSSKNFDQTPTFTFFEELLEQGMREGWVEKTDPIRLKHFHFGALRAVLMAAMLDPSRDFAEEGRIALELFLRAIQPRDKGSPPIFASNKKSPDPDSTQHIPSFDEPSGG